MRMPVFNIALGSFWLIIQQVLIEQLLRGQAQFQILRVNQQANQRFPFSWSLLLVGVVITRWWQSYATCSYCDASLMRKLCFLP